MSLRRTIHEVLQAAPAVTALIGAGGAIRHYPLRAPQGTALPYLVSQKVVSKPMQSHGTPEDGEDTMDETLMQFTAVSDDPDAGASLITAVRGAFMDPATNPDCRALLDTAHIVATGPDEREVSVDEIDGVAPQLDLTFFHNPQT
jgi:hypothetical protein